jgi:hypothetical protein
MLMAITMVINIIFWATMFALIAWGFVFLTGALHALIHTTALSFWQSVGVVLALSLPIVVLLRSDRRKGV